MRSLGIHIERVAPYLGKLLQQFIDANADSPTFTFFVGDTAERLIARDDLAMWLWTLYGSPIAYGHLQTFPGNEHKQHVGRFGVCVDKASRNKGLGTAVVAHLLQEAATAGLVKIVATVYEDNPAMLAIYLGKYGFVQEGGFVDEERWDDESRDILSLAKRI